MPIPLEYQPPGVARNPGTKIAFVYIDALNFYYNKARPANAKWVDFKKLCAAILPEGTVIAKIVYCTSKVQNLPGDPEARDRQDIFLRALKAWIPGIQIVFGQMKERKKTGVIADSDPPEKTTILTFEEKGSDVNLGVHLVNDANKEDFDYAVVMSNDSDLAEAMKIAREDCGKNDVATQHSKRQISSDSRTGGTCR